jgi:predicted RNA-binding protein with PIN domain
VTAGGAEARSDEPAPPSAAWLEALDSDRWAALLPLLRRGLRELEGSAVTPVVARLRAAPTSRLAGGRSRRDLARLVAAGGPLWTAVLGELRSAAPSPEELAWLLRGDAPPQPAEPEAPPTAALRSGDAAEELARLRERLRVAGAKRDAARRQAEGEAARAAALEQELRATRATATEAAAERDAARGELTRLAAEQQRAVDRERRRQQARIAELEAEVAALRRRDEEWRTALRRRDEQVDRLREQAGRRSGEQDSPLPDRFVPGRPSQLPDEVTPGTTQAARLLLHAGRLLLVDGYNVTRTHRPQLDLEGQRSWLILRLTELAARHGVRPQVVFDGQQSGGARPAAAWRGVAVRFTAAGITADDELVLDVEATDEPVTVVTDDQELTRRLRASGADVIGTRAFLGVVG